MGNADSMFCGNEEFTRVNKNQLEDGEPGTEATGPRKHWSEEELARVDTSHSF